ncbi:MAG: M20/M25/M40 family metallo-hydrolase, partial [Methyloprofundus sp.]|nr:M20/M25/M40 family metallo-hydrolase [Methyloprofundus sp.]
MIQFKMQKIFLIALGIIIALLLIVIVNTLTNSSRQINMASIEGISVDSQKAAERLSLAIKLKTISHQKTEAFIAEPFLQLIDLISDTFPKVEANLEKKVINHYSLLYKWSGRNSSLKPVIFLAHLDVVPPETESEWRYPPFMGTIADGYIWGRGTLDDKSSVFGVLEAVEHLISQGFVPNRTIYLAFGHDEEIGGKQGAAAIAQYLKQQGVNSLFTLDEGMVILDENLSPAQKVTAIIGVAEKGYVTLKLNARAEGGHSSMPAKVSAVGLLANAITALEENQLPSTLSGASGKMFDFIGPEMGFAKRILFANRWLFGDLIISILEEKKTTAAMVRTTTAVTMVSGGVKENVLPSQASAVANFRILPGSSSKDVLNHARKVIA